jgi:tRNA A-37 threonylcarbamoyl transferase component Bud32
LRIGTGVVVRQQEFILQYQPAANWLINGLLAFSAGCMVYSAMLAGDVYAHMSGTRPLSQPAEIAATSAKPLDLTSAFTKKRIESTPQPELRSTGEDLVMARGFSLACFLYATGAFFWLAMLMRERRILLRQAGLTFPAHMWGPLLFRRHRTWGDIGAVGLTDEQLATSGSHSLPGRHDRKPGLEDRQMVFYFQSGGTARVNLEQLAMSDLENFFKASKHWGSTAVIAPELIDLKRKLFSGPKKTQQVSFTTLWEEDLQAHFTATTFVPLDKGRSLQNGRFKVLSQLAAGGLSAIYLAEMPDKRLVVLKEAVVPATADDASRNKAKVMFEREARLLLRLEHPRIARVSDHFIEGGRDYLVLEYIRGQSLRQLVSQAGPQSEEQVLLWAGEIAQILKYLHDQDPPIIHRDISPDNLVLREDGKLFLIDFGAANEFVGTATGTLIGKQCYIAPEQFRGKAAPASDIYGLGGTLFFLLTGQEPEALSEAHPASVRNTLSGTIDEFVAALTRTDAQERISNADSLIKNIIRLREAPDPGQVIKTPQRQKEHA